MNLYLNNEHPQSRISRRYLEKRIRKILKVLGCANSTLGVTFVTDREIARLNRLFLKKRGPTDVLSFPMDSKGILGDVVVSVDTARRQANRDQRAVQEEYLRLIVHGILHLLGYDHNVWKDYEKMRKREGELQKMIGMKVR